MPSAGAQLFGPACGIGQSELIGALACVAVERLRQQRSKGVYDS